MQVEAAPSEALVTASLRRRFVALLVDAIILVPVDIIGYFLFSESEAFFWTSVVLIACYSIVFTTAAGGTPGKLILGIYVGDKAGQRIGMQRSIVRHLAFSFFYLELLLPFLFVLSLLAFIVSVLMALMDPQRRALHDRIAGTRVLRGKAPPGL